MIRLNDTPILGTGQEITLTGSVKTLEGMGVVFSPLAEIIRVRCYEPLTGALIGKYTHDTAATIRATDGIPIIPGDPVVLNRSEFQSKFIASGSDVIAMTEQFGAIPVQAFGDERLSANDFRVMGAIAYFDRLGRNGAGCYVDPRKLVELSAVDYTHLNRHTRRLKDFGYLKIGRSATDRRKRVYSLIYNEDRAVVANAGDNLDAGAKGDRVSPFNDENVANSGDILPENVAKPNSQPFDPQAKLPPKRLSEAYIKDPAKRIARDGENTAQGNGRKPTNFARQGDRGGGNSRAQGRMLLPIQGGGAADGTGAPNRPAKARASTWEKTITNDASQRLCADLVRANPSGEWLAMLSAKQLEAATDTELRKPGAGMAYLRACLANKGVLLDRITRRRPSRAPRGTWPWQHPRCN